MRVGILGCGLIGGKRAAALGEDTLTAVCDRDAARAHALAARTGARPCGSPAELFGLCDAVVVATTNDQLAPLAAQALEAGKHVLVEKPAARNAAELKPVIALAARSGRVVKVGFNHRFHPAAIRAREILDAGDCGPVMFVRGRYGHGGRVGYDREWRADPVVAGGGELIDQGVHLIDLARWYLGGEFARVSAQTATFFWKMPVEDNAFLTLTTASGQIAHLHASCTEWKNLFSFEIYCRVAKLHLEGLGGSYGLERLHHHRMRPEMGPPETVIHEYPGPDQSWALEWHDFSRAAITGGAVRGDLGDALAALRIVDEVYGR
ncbi:MAG TPA: Gfo/Idh/MocA family oxidoreductase [Myxococcales bacterium]|nr:Gfo/Idh/MocA family oxidoreductase [Myxococcales bacterium]